MHDPGEKVLAVDIGLSAVKAGVFDANGALVALIESPNRAVRHNSTSSCVDMKLLWAQVCDVVAQCLTKVQSPASIKAVGLCGHGNGAYLIDHRGQDKCGVSSMDTRAQPLLNRERMREKAATIAKLVGGHLWAGQPLAILAVLKDELSPGLTLLFAKDYVRYRLTGLCVTDPGDASAAGLVDLNTGRWSHSAMSLFGLDGFCNLPDLATSSCQITGTVNAIGANQTHLPEGTPVVAGSIDLAMGAMGDGLADEATLHVTAGTWGIHQLRRSQRVRPMTILQTIRSPWCGADEMLWVESSPTSAINLTCLQRLFATNTDPFAQWETCLNDQIALDDPVYLPYPLGCWDMPNQRAVFANIAMNPGPAKAVRAVYEGIVLGHLRQIHKYQSLTNDINRLMVTGGLTRSAAWVRMLCDAAQLPVEIADNPHAALRGAAMCAAKSIKMNSFSPGPALKRITPLKARKTHWQRRYELFNNMLEHRRVDV